VGDTAAPPPDILASEPGDIVTHMWLPCAARHADDNGKVLPQVIQA
jgi:hypothetical protein